MVTTLGHKGNWRQGTTLQLGLIIAPSKTSARLQKKQNMGTQGAFWSWRVTQVEPHILLQPVCALPGNQTRATRTAAPRTARSRNRHRNSAPLSLHSNDANWSVKNSPQFAAVPQMLLNRYVALYSMNGLKPQKNFTVTLPMKLNCQRWPHNTHTNQRYIQVCLANSSLLDREEDYTNFRYGLLVG